MLSCTPPENLFCARFFFFQLGRMTTKTRRKERTSLEIDPPLWSWRKFILLSFVSRLWASIVSSDASPRFCTATCHQSSSLWRINQDSNHSLALCLLLPRLDSYWAFNSRTLGKLDCNLKTYEITSFLEKAERNQVAFGLSLQKGDSATSFQLFDFSFFLTFLVSFEFQVDFLPRMPSFENSSAWIHESLKDDYF